MKANFENSVNVLVKAYFNDTLRHGNCYACAVGNLVAESSGTKVVKCNMWNFSHCGLGWSNLAPYPALHGEKIQGWGAVFSTDTVSVDDEDYPRPIRQVQSKNMGNYFGEPKKQIDSTGYTLEELARVEFAFESARGHNDDDRMLNGLMAVVEVLADIHQIDLTAKENAIGQFQKVKSEKVTA